MTNYDQISISPPAPPKWRCHLFNGVDYFPAGDRPVPNAFHRLMQRLILGIRWIKGSED